MYGWRKIIASGVVAQGAKIESGRKIFRRIVSTKPTNKKKMTTNSET